MPTALQGFRENNRERRGVGPPCQHSRAFSASGKGLKRWPLILSPTVRRREAPSRRGWPLARSRLWPSFETRAIARSSGRGRSMRRCCRAAKSALLAHAGHTNKLRPARDFGAEKRIEAISLPPAAIDTDLFHLIRHAENGS